MLGAGRRDQGLVLVFARVGNRRLVLGWWGSGCCGRQEYRWRSVFGVTGWG